MHSLFDSSLVEIQNSLSLEQHQKEEKTILRKLNDPKVPESKKAKLRVRKGVVEKKIEFLTKKIFS